MKNKILILLAVALLSVSSVAMALNNRVFDDADLFMPESEALIQARIEEICADGKADIAVHTADSGVADTTSYADDYYEAGGFGVGDNHTGVLFFIDMQNRITYISTEGDMIDLIDDQREEDIFDAQTDYLADGDYAGAVLKALDMTEQYIEAGVAKGFYAYDEKTGEKLSPEEYGSTRKEHSPTLTEIGISLAAGLLVGGVTVLFIRSSYKKPFKEVPYAFREKGRLSLTRDESRLTNKFVTTRRIPKNQNNGGGGHSGGVHTSSSGRSHGGGGRGF